VSNKQARVGDSLSHNGATIITGSSIRFTDGRKVARRGDLVNCPLHGVNEIVSTLSSPLFTEDPDTANVRSIAKCGAVIITGSDITSHER
jgi:uncharacterized Zn-binding protein involved in type VI secretion